MNHVFDPTIQMYKVPLMNDNVDVENDVNGMVENGQFSFFTRWSFIFK